MRLLPPDRCCVVSASLKLSEDLKSTDYFVSFVTGEFTKAHLLDLLVTNFMIV
jgi:hypothetical protein